MFNVKVLLITLSFASSVFCMEKKTPVINDINDNSSPEFVKAKDCLISILGEFNRNKDDNHLYKNLYCSLIAAVSWQLGNLGQLTGLIEKLIEDTKCNKDGVIYFTENIGEFDNQLREDLKGFKDKKEYIREEQIGDNLQYMLYVDDPNNIPELYEAAILGLNDLSEIESLNQKYPFSRTQYPHLCACIDLNLLIKFYHDKMIRRCSFNCGSSNHVGPVIWSGSCQPNALPDSNVQNIVNCLFAGIVPFKNLFDACQQVSSLIHGLKGVGSVTHDQLPNILDSIEGVKALLYPNVISLVKRLYKECALEAKPSHWFLGYMSPEACDTGLPRAEDMFFGLGNEGIDKPFSALHRDARKELLADYRNTKANCSKPIKKTKIQQGGSKNNKDKNKKKYDKHGKNSNNDSLKPVKNNTRYKKINNDKKDNSRNYLSLEEKRELLIEQIKSAPLFCVEPYYERCKNIKESGEEKASPYHTYPYLLDFVTRVFGLPINEEKSTIGYYVPCTVRRDEAKFSMVYVILCYFVGDDKDKRCVEFHRGPAMLNTIIPDSLNLKGAQLIIKNMYQELKASLRKEPFYRKTDGVYDNDKPVVQLDPFNNDFSGNVIFSKQANYITIEDHYNNQVIEVPMIFNA